MMVKDLNSLKGKNIKIETVMFCGSGHSVYDEGVVEDVVMGGSTAYFIILDSGVMVSSRYIRRIEILA